MLIEASMLMTAIAAFAFGALAATAALCWWAWRAMDPRA